MENFDLSQLPPEALEQLIAMGTITEEQAILSKQIAQAEGVRSAAGPKGRHTGRMYVAANPLEHLVSGIKKYKAKKDLKGLGEEQDALLEQTRSGRKTFAELLRGPQAEPEAYGPPSPQAPMPGSSRVGPMGPPAPDMPVTRNPGNMAPPPPSPNIPPPQVPGDQMAIAAGGDTSRNIGGPTGNVSVSPPRGQPGDMYGSFDAKYMPQIAGSSGLTPEQMRQIAAQLRGM